MISNKCILGFWISGNDFLGFNRITGENGDNEEDADKDKDKDTDEKSDEESGEDMVIISDDDSAEVSQEGIKLLVILVDGFRWDYVSLDKSLKGFPKIAENGVRAKYVKPIFPANSYPNWYAIATGLYGESHGMFENYMYDQSRDEVFLMSPHPNASHPQWWNQSEPIWINAQKNGVKTAMYLWDGCQVRIDGVRPYICHKYRGLYELVSARNQTKTFLNTVLDDFADDKYRLALVYYELVDHNGMSRNSNHRYHCLNYIYFNATNKSVVRLKCRIGFR